MVEREQLITMVKGVQAGDEAAMARMYETFHEDFYYFILKTVNNDRELAEDLVQDTFVEILETIHKLEEPAAFVTWAKQIAYHKCTAYFRKKKELLLDENEDGTSVFDIQEEENAEFIPDEALDSKELKQTVMAMINELPEEQRAALLLRYFNEVSVKEIAQIQNVSEGTVKSRLNYARKSIKQAVESYEKKNGVKLHCVGVLPLLLWLFREYRVANDLSMAAGTATQTFVLAEETAAAAGMVAVGGAAAGAATTATSATTTAAAVAAKSAAAVGVKAAATALSTKIVAGVAAAALLVGGTAAGAAVAKKNSAPQPVPEAAIVQTMDETEPAEAVIAEETIAEATEAPTETTEEATTEPTKAPTEPEVCEHRWEIDQVRDDGLALYRCEVCDAVYEAYAEEEAPTEPAACEHQWGIDNVRDDGLTLYRCEICDAVMESYECPHNKYSEEYWTDPNDGTVYTFHTCTTCGFTYSSSGTPGTDDYEVGSGAPDGYSQQQQQNQPTEPETTVPVCEAHNWKLVSEEPGVTIFECTNCGEQMSQYEENCTHPEYKTYEEVNADGSTTITYWCTSCGSSYIETVS